MATTERLEDFPAKTSPTTADLVYVGNAADSNNEVKSTVGQIINAYPALTSIGELTTTADRMIYTTASDTYAVSVLTSFSRTLLADSSASDMRDTLGLGTASLINTPIPMPDGGTGKPLTASNGGIVYTDADSMEILAPTSTAGQMLQSGANAAPNWSTPTYPSASGTLGKIIRSDGTNNIYSSTTYSDSYSDGSLLWSDGANNVTQFIPTGRAVLVTTELQKPVYTSSMTNGQTIIGSSTGRPVAATPGAGTGLSITLGSGSFSYSLQTPVSLGNGGTNSSLTASNGGIVYSTASALAILSSTPTANLPLLSGSSAAPAWGSYALTLGGTLTTAEAFTTSGAFPVTLTFTGSTNVTFPTSGTLATTSGTIANANKMLITDENAYSSAVYLTWSYNTSSYNDILVSSSTLKFVPSTGRLAATSYTGAWAGSTIGTAFGGTGLTGYITGDIIYASATNTLSKLAANTSASNVQFLSMINSVPAWYTMRGINAQTGTTYTTVLADNNQHLTFSNASAQTITLPQQSTTTTPTSYNFWATNLGAGLVTFIKEGAETLTGNVTLAQNASCYVQRVSTTGWNIFGGTSTVNTEYSIPIIKAATANDVAYFTLAASYAGTILSCSQTADSLGTAGTYDVSIDGVGVTGLTSVTNVASKTTTNATAANTFSVGSVIKLTLSAAVASGVNMAFTLNCTRTY